ncbi:MAG: hypothetical protein JNJ57_05785 [Saprospiraceae bacterium]|nr:hypothetical protein [Saprospiraceae bacterium]
MKLTIGTILGSRDVGIECEVKAFESRQALTDALLLGEIHAFWYPLVGLPVNLPTELAITAVSERENPALALYMRTDLFTPGEIFKLKKGAAVIANAPGIDAQLADIRPDVRFVSGGGLDDLKSEVADALILPVSQAPGPSDEYFVLELNPREFFPLPGQGVWAFVCLRSDTATRLVLKAAHHPEVSACTNVERGLLKSLGQEWEGRLAACCQRDANGNYHAGAALLSEKGLLRAYASSSTYLGLVEALKGRLG